MSSSAEEKDCVRTYQESDGPLATGIWVAGLQQTTDNVLWVFQPLISYVFDKEAKHVTSLEGDTGADGSNIAKHWSGEDRCFFVATSKNTSDDQEEVVGCVGVIQNREIGHEAISDKEHNFSSEKFASIYLSLVGKLNSWEEGCGGQVDATSRRLGPRSWVPHHVVEFQAIPEHWIFTSLLVMRAVPGTVAV